MPDALSGVASPKNRTRSSGIRVFRLSKVTWPAAWLRENRVAPRARKENERCMFPLPECEVLSFTEN